MAYTILHQTTCQSLCFFSTCVMLLFPMSFHTGPTHPADFTAGRHGRHPPLLLEKPGAAGAPQLYERQVGAAVCCSLPTWWGPGRGGGGWGVLVKLPWRQTCRGMSFIKRALSRLLSLTLPVEQSNAEIPGSLINNMQQRAAKSSI